jgi:hypothetical protein
VTHGRRVDHTSLAVRRDLRRREQCRKKELGEVKVPEEVSRYLNVNFLLVDLLNRGEHDASGVEKDIKAFFFPEKNDY